MEQRTGLESFKRFILSAVAHAFVIEAEKEEGIAAAAAFIEREFGLQAHDPDVTILRYGLFAVDDARDVATMASRAPSGVRGSALVLAADRAYHEAQNALLKLFEEPPQGVRLFLILPTLGGLLPTLRSRVQVLARDSDALKASHEQNNSPLTEAFLRSEKEKRTALIKKLASGKDEEERRSHRDEAIALVNGIEGIAYERFVKDDRAVVELLSDIAALRSYLYDRSAPVRLILEHLALVVDTVTW